MLHRKVEGEEREGKMIKLCYNIKNKKKTNNEINKMKMKSQLHQFIKIPVCLHKIKAEITPIICI